MTDRQAALIASVLLGSRYVVTEEEILRQAESFLGWLEGEG